MGGVNLGQVSFRWIHLYSGKGGEGAPRTRGGVEGARTSVAPYLSFRPGEGARCVHPVDLYVQGGEGAVR